MYDISCRSAIITCGTHVLRVAPGQHAFWRRLSYTSPPDDPLRKFLEQLLSLGLTGQVALAKPDAPPDITGQLSKVPDGQTISIILDDLTLERCSDKAPACRIHHQHSKKKNRCVYLLRQCWVFLAIAFQRPSDKVHTAIPVMAFPSPKSGNISKLKIAKAMLKSVRQTLQGRVLRLLTDCWFMNYT